MFLPPGTELITVTPPPRQTVSSEQTFYPFCHYFVTVTKKGPGDGHWAGLELAGKSHTSVTGISPVTEVDETKEIFF